MKEFIWNLIQGMGAFFHSPQAKQEVTKTEKNNRNIRKLQEFLTDRFDFRHNQLTGVTEYRPKGSTGMGFHPIVL